MPKIIPKLTEIEVKNAKPRSKAYKLCDEGGLRLLIRPTGTKVWQYPYRFQGKHKTFTIGHYGEILLTEARELRDKARALVKEGIDPNHRKQDLFRENLAAADNSFEAVAREWHTKQSIRWSPSHAKKVLGRLKKDVFDHIGYKPIKEVAARDIISILRKMETRGVGEGAKKVNQYCVAIFDYAILLDLCDTNPAIGRGKIITVPKPKPFSHLNETELPDFLKRLHATNDYHLLKLAVKLLILTFVRPGELRHARWDEFNEHKTLWEIPAERMKMGRNHVVPLSNQALFVLQQIKQISGNGDLLFPGQRRINQPYSDIALLKTVKKLSKDKSVAHGFRHTASTILNEYGFNWLHIERQLAHVDENSVRGTYNKAEYLVPRRSMMQWWADHLDHLSPAGSFIPASAGFQREEVTNSQPVIHRQTEPVPETYPYIPAATGFHLPPHTLQIRARMSSAFQAVIRGPSL